MNPFIKTILQTGVPFGFLMGIFFSFINGWQTGTIGGIVSGIIFGLAASVFVAYQEKKFTKDRPLMPEETLLKEGRANHFFNGEGVGGWIYLTNTRLYFKSHNSNIQNHDLSIPLLEIDYAEKANTFGFIPNQLRLTLRDGQVEKFVVSEAKDWVGSIKKLI
jgi:hypothetical protein